eukprot:TRINITY_DN572_c0_g1_i20.p1 TRINITY_DN572_c0_g1~~TRINITY_DN572_c0_g1_i20.p1  ORF type:complete len:241 (+),score=24.92 TRINITY_DN572_c0_g1_i20:121-843(+)
MINKPQQRSFFALTLIICAWSQVLNSQTVEMVIQITRHGARAPKDAYFNKGFWSRYNLGDLTPSGMRMMYLLGQEMRQRYIIQNKLLPDQYNHFQIKIKTNTDQRTVNSALSFLRGMYPDDYAEQLSDELITKSVPPINCQLASTTIQTLGNQAIIHGETLYNMEFVPRINDLFFHGSSEKNCPIADELYVENKKKKDNKMFIEYIKKVFQRDFVTIVNHYSEKKIDDDMKLQELSLIHI